MDISDFEERAAIIEFEAGLGRYQAETMAARAAGMTRKEALNEIRKRDFEQARNQGQASGRQSAGAMSRVQPGAAQEAGPVPKRHVQA